MRLVQLAGPEGRCIARVEEPRLRLLKGIPSIYGLALEVLKQNVCLSDVVDQMLTDHLLDYEEVYLGKSKWRILPSADHPEERPDETLLVPFHRDSMSPAALRPAAPPKVVLVRPESPPEPMDRLIGELTTEAQRLGLALTVLKTRRIPASRDWKSRPIQRSRT